MRRVAAQAQTAGGIFLPDSNNVKTNEGEGSEATPAYVVIEYEEQRSSDSVGGSVGRSIAVSKKYLEPWEQQRRRRTGRSPAGNSNCHVIEMKIYSHPGGLKRTFVALPWLTSLALTRYHRSERCLALPLICCEGEIC